MRSLLRARRVSIDAAGKALIIVISYAHADEPDKPAEGEVKWLSFVTGYLRPAIKHGAVEIWLDRFMRGGADSEREIASKLRGRASQRATPPCRHSR